MLRHHAKLERSSIGFLLAIVGVASIGGIVEIAPLFTIPETVEADPNMRIYTPLELAGRNVYIQEGCNACHSQMVRTLQDDVDRYGPYSLAVESQYDHPMLWGSKRTGPDLARVGGKYSDQWHVDHFENPRSLIEGSVMPAYPWLARNPADLGSLSDHLAALQNLGVPYTDEMVANAEMDARSQTSSDGFGEVQKRYGEDTNIRNFDGDDRMVSELDALIAYLQVLGTLSDLPHENEGKVEVSTSNLDGEGS